MRIPINEYVQLCRAGYTAEEIADFVAGVEPTPTPTPTTPEPAPTPADPAPTDQTPDPAPSDPAESDTQKMLRELLGIARAGMIGGVSRDNSPAPDPTAIMATILSPNPPNTPNK